MSRIDTETKINEKNYLTLSKKKLQILAVSVVYSANSAFMLHYKKKI